MKDYEMLPRDKFLSFWCSFQQQIRPQNTVTFLHEVDLSELERVRARAQAQAERPSYTAFVVKALALALRGFPFANRRVAGRLLGGPRAQQFRRCDIAVAAERDLPEAPMASTIDVLRDADKHSLAQITRWLRELATCDPSNNAQWRSFSTIIQRLPRWLALLLVGLPRWWPKMWVRYRGGAALVSSPGKYGVDAILGTWAAPLGVSFGLVKRRAVVRGEEVVPCPTFLLTLNFDRRLMAGAQAARFFRRIVDILEHAETELTSDPLSDGEAPRSFRPAAAPTRA